jgi:hypothetical protein
MYSASLAQFGVPSPVAASQPVVAGKPIEQQLSVQLLSPDVTSWNMLGYWVLRTAERNKNKNSYTFGISGIEQRSNVS